jgi:cupin domain
LGKSVLRSFAQRCFAFKFEFMESKKPPHEFPYKTYLNILHEPLEVIDVRKIADVCTDKWYNQTLCKVNDSVVRMAVIQGEYHWHEHNDIDEFFFVLEGRFLIDLEDRVVDLTPRQGFVVPKGVRHRTRAPERTVILMVERADIVPTGD